MHSTTLLSAVLLLVSLFVIILGCGDDDDSEEANEPADDDSETDDENEDNDDTADDDGQEVYAKVGFGRVDITPDVPVKMAGYGAYFLSERFCRWSTGVHDPLFATAMAVEDPGGEAMILIVQDTVGVITNEVKEIQQGIAVQTGLDVDSVIVAATHNHHGPDTIGLFGVIIPPISGRQEDVIDELVAGSVEAGVAAWFSRKPATLAHGEGTEPDLHFNKVFLAPDRLTDDTMSLIAAYDLDGDLIGTSMNWAAHPTLMTAENTLISSDYPGAYYRKMEERLDGIHMFVNGAIGASIQIFAVETPWLTWFKQDADWEDLDQVGQALAEDAIALLDDAVPIDEPTLWLKQSSDVQALVENLLFRLAYVFHLVPREVPPVGQYGTTYMTTFALGPVTFGTVPGEYGPDYSFMMREIMGGETQFIIGLGQDWIGYAITPEQYTRLAYIYERFLCPSRWAGEELMDVYHEIWDPVYTE